MTRTALSSRETRARPWAAHHLMVVATPAAVVARTQCSSSSSKSCGEGGGKQERRRSRQLNLRGGRTLPYLRHASCHAQSRNGAHHDVSGNSGFFRAERGAVMASSRRLRSSRVQGLE